MSSKDRDLVELARFQLGALDFCQQINLLGKKLLNGVESAEISLQDDVSRVLLHRIESIADKLVSTSSYGQQELATALSRTRAELTQWNDM